MKSIKLLFGWLPVPERVVCEGVEYISLYLNEKGIWINIVKYKDALTACSQEAYNRALKSRNNTTWERFLNELDNVSEALYQMIKYKRTNDERIEMIYKFYDLNLQKGDIICFVNRTDRRI